MSLFFSNVSVIFHNRKVNFFGSGFLLLAILCAAFSPVIFAERQITPETVYCPLTHQFQPIKAEKTDEFESLDEICASDGLKNEFSTRLSNELAVKPLESSSIKISKLVFDFWRDGKSAFDSVPRKSDQNQQLAAKNSFFAISSGSRDENSVVFKLAQKRFAFQTKPRPPTIEISAAFDFQNSQTLEKISRRIAPRAPPFFS